MGGGEDPSSLRFLRDDSRAYSWDDREELLCEMDLFLWEG